MSETGGASEMALAVWDVLADDARHRRGWATATRLMKRAELTRPEVVAALRELVAGHWVQRTVVEEHGRLIEHWRAAGFGDRDAKVAAE